MRKEQLIKNPCNLLPHFVLLGAGASRAAFPDGDGIGQQLPLMEDFVDIVGLQPILKKAGLENMEGKNFEEVYSDLTSKSEYKGVVRELEQRIEEYFSGLSLRDDKQVTLYDYLLLSLRPKDAVFTFNWDPFLFNTHQRHSGKVPLPRIFFLHGNVSIGACSDHPDKWGRRGTQCPVCHKRFSDVPLLYPVKEKDYSRNPFIHNAWEEAKILLSSAFTLTIFGYSAPNADEDAMGLLKDAWFKDSNREREHVEIIDTDHSELLQGKWKSFVPTKHDVYKKKFQNSRIVDWPRRSCESLSLSMCDGTPCEKFPLRNPDTLVDLQEYAMEIARHEKQPA